MIDKVKNGRHSVREHKTATTEPLKAPEVAKILNISLRTVHRLVERGLLSATEVEGHYEFTEKAVDRFLKKHPEEAEYAAAYSRMTEKEKGKILRRARSLAPKMGIKILCITLGKETSRTADTIRRLIASHDEAHPEDPIIDLVSSPLSRKTREKIQEEFEYLDTPIAALAKKYHRSYTRTWEIVTGGKKKKRK